jgi:predicted nucleic-acid-binding protein
MRGVDTNILVRFLVRDDEQQAGIVYKIFKTAETEKKDLFVPLLVVLELIWVLESAYAVSRTDILDSIGDLLAMPIFKFEHQSALQQFTSSAPGNNYELSDLLIAHSAKINGCETTLTLDKKASRFVLFELAK